MRLGEHDRLRRGFAAVQQEKLHLSLFYGRCSMDHHVLKTSFAIGAEPGVRPVQLGR